MEQQFIEVCLQNTDIRMSVLTAQRVEEMLNECNLDISELLSYAVKTYTTNYAQKKIDDAAAEKEATQAQEPKKIKWQLRTQPADSAHVAPAKTSYDDLEDLDTLFDL